MTDDNTTPATASAPVAEVTHSDDLQDIATNEGENAADYVEQRKDDQAAEAEASKGKEEEPRKTERRRLSRHQRYQRALDYARTEAMVNQALQEAEANEPMTDRERDRELKRLEIDLETENKLEDPIDYRAIDERLEHEAAAADMQDLGDADYLRSEEFKADAAQFQARVHQFAQSIPDYDATIMDGADINIPASLEREILKSPHGPAITYNLAKHGREIAAQLANASPEEHAAFVREAERYIAYGQKHRGPQSRVRAHTAAPPPYARITGGAGPTSTAHSLSEGSDVSGYVAWRRGGNG